MKSCRFVPLALAAGVLLLAAGCQSRQAAEEARIGRVTELIQQTVEPGAVPATARGDLEQRRAWKALTKVYRERSFQPIWVGGGGPLERAEELTAALAEAEAQGLDPNDYDISRLDALRADAEAALEAEEEETVVARRLADLDLVYTYAFLAHAIHLTQGRVAPEEMKVTWRTEPRQAEPVAVLAQLTADDSRSVSDVLGALVPPHESYRQLLEARRRYRDIAAAGGWPAVGDEPLSIGDRGERVVLLRRRLAIEGDLEADADAADAADAATASPLYDKALGAAVARFQKRHGIEPDGEAGAATLAALNVPAEERLRTLDLNIERWRWMPESLGERHILVNIPSYRMWVIEGGEPTVEMKVIVGKRYNETPVFSDTMTYVVLNPSWNIPQSIASGEIAPKLASDPGYADRKGLQVLNPDGSSAGVHPAAVDWSGEGKRYILREPPGPANPLGQVKFMFPNEFNIYLHDTPGDHLFERGEREFSHGCIRLERPLDLAEHLLGWPRSKIDQTLASREEKSVQLDQPLPVHILYWTAWVGDEGEVHFRPDVYGHDGRLAEALARQPPVALKVEELAA